MADCRVTNLTTLELEVGEWVSEQKLKNPNITWSKIRKNLPDYLSHLTQTQLMAHWKAYRESVRSEKYGNGEELLEEEIRKLDYLWSKLQDRIDQGDTKAIIAASKIIETKLKATGVMTNNNFYLTQNNVNVTTDELSSKLGEIFSNARKVDSAITRIANEEIKKLDE